MHLKLINLPTKTKCCLRKCTRSNCDNLDVTRRKLGQCHYLHFYLMEVCWKPLAKYRQPVLQSMVEFWRLVAIIIDVIEVLSCMWHYCNRWRFSIVIVTDLTNNFVAFVLAILQSDLGFVASTYWSTLGYSQHPTMELWGCIWSTLYKII